MPSTTKARERCAAFRLSVGRVVAVRVGDADGVAEAVALRVGLLDGLDGLTELTEAPDWGAGVVLLAGAPTVQPVRTAIPSAVTRHSRRNCRCVAGGGTASR